MSQQPSNPLPIAPAIPVQAGVGLAAGILGGLCVALAVCLGVTSLCVSLPVFGLWYFLPVIVVTIALGIFASRSVTGVAGAVLGVVALLICMGFIVVDRLYGPDLRAQMSHAATVNNPPAGLSADQIMNVVRGAATHP